MIATSFNSGGPRTRRVSVLELRTSRANLTHLIYSMEHDPSLNAAESKISSLKTMLESIEHQLTTDARISRFA